MNEIVIDNTPYESLPERKSKYDSLFAALCPGQCLMMDSKRVSSVASSLRRWLKVRKLDSTYKVVTTNLGNDGRSRVYLLKK